MAEEKVLTFRHHIKGGADYGQLKTKAS